MTSRQALNQAGQQRDKPWGRTGRGLPDAGTWPSQAPVELGLQAGTTWVLGQSPEYLPIQALAQDSWILFFPGPGSAAPPPPPRTPTWEQA